MKNNFLTSVTCKLAGDAMAFSSKLALSSVEEGDRVLTVASDSEHLTVEVSGLQCEQKSWSPATLEAVNCGIADTNDANSGDTGATTKVTKLSVSSSAPTNIRI